MPVIMEKEEFKSQLILRKVMNKLGVSCAELGRRLGVSRQAISKVVNEHTDINVRHLHRIANALGVRVRDLFEE